MVADRQKQGEEKLTASKKNQSNKEKVVLRVLRPGGTDRGDSGRLKGEGSTAGVVKKESSKKKEFCMASLAEEAPHCHLYA